METGYVSTLSTYTPAAYLGLGLERALAMVLRGVLERALAADKKQRTASSCGRA